MDRILASFLGLGLRGSRARIAVGDVLLDGKPARKGDLVGPGQTVSVHEEVTGERFLLRTRVIGQTERYAAVFKPGGMHCVAGKGEECVELDLPRLGLPGWLLVNRLDFLTSGLVLVVRSQADALDYKKFQDQGEVKKYYLAIAHGRIPQALQLDARILDQRRKVVRVTDEPDVFMRSTLVEPVAYVGETTVVLARIFKGRRHQIRAHLANAGHPLVGDPVYGRGEAGGLFLHHALVIMPGFLALNPPPWPSLPDQVLSVMDHIVQHAG